MVWLFCQENRVEWLCRTSEGPYLDLKKGGGANEDYDYIEVFTDHDFEHKKSHSCWHQERQGFKSLNRKRQSRKTLPLDIMLAHFAFVCNRKLKFSFLLFLSFCFVLRCTSSHLLCEARRSVSVCQTLFEKLGEIMPGHLFGTNICGMIILSRE